MAAPQVMSNEELFQLTGSWEAAAALRDQQNSALNQYNWSQQAAAAPTNNTLSGNIMAGASWNSNNTSLQDLLTQTTGQQTSNYAVGGSTTTDTLKQLNSFIDGGGKFDSNATVYLQTGGVDFLNGVDKGTIKDNISSIVKTLGDQGVNVVLTGSPYASSLQDVMSNNFSDDVDPLFKEIANENSNVALVNSQGAILKNKDLLVDALHTNAAGTSAYNQSVIDAASQFNNKPPSSTSQMNTYTAENVNKLAEQILAQGTTSQWTGGLDAQTSAKYMADELAKSGITDINQVGKSDSGIINTLTGQNLVSGYGERTGGNLWSGSYEGKGNTGFGVQFDAQGKPIFYTQGASSSDVGDLAPLIAVAAAAFGAPYLSSVIAGTTGLTGTALAAATGAAVGGGTAALTGGNVLKGALYGGAGGALFGGAGNASQAAADADLAAGLDPTYGQNYDSVMKDLMTQSPGVADSIYGVHPDYSLQFPSTPYETGLTPSNTPNLDYMNGAQGLNPTNIYQGLDSMGGANGLTLPNTPSTNLSNILTTTAGGSVLGNTLSGIDTGVSNLSGTTLNTGGTGVNTGGSGVNTGGTGTGSAFPWTSLASSLYDMYAKNQMADQWQAQVDKVNKGIEGLYAPGSAEYQALWNDMSRKDAAAGRNSQYGVRSVDLAGKIAPIKTNAMVQSLQPMTTMLNNQMQNQYGGLNSLFYNMANNPTMNSAINTGVSSAVNSGLNAIGNWISGG